MTLFEATIIRMAAATSMAAAVAASIPAPQAAPTPSAPTYEAIPASMSKVIDLEAEIPITSVQLDSMVSTFAHTSRLPSVRLCVYALSPLADQGRLPPASVPGWQAHVRAHGWHLLSLCLFRASRLCKFLGSRLHYQWA